MALTGLCFNGGDRKAPTAIGAVQGLALTQIIHLEVLPPCN
jgi:hypothetical protein